MVRIARALRGRTLLYNYGRLDFQSCCRAFCSNDFQAAPLLMIPAVSMGDEALLVLLGRHFVL